MVSKLTKLGILTTITTVSSYLYLDYRLAQKYPNIPISSLPPQTQFKSSSTLLHTKLQVSNKSNTYIAYSDNYKRTIPNTSITAAYDKFVNFFKIYIDLAAPSSSPLQASIIYESELPDGTKTVVFQWSWDTKFGIVKKFEDLAMNWNYPYRLMNGGYHEITIMRNRDDNVDVYFLTAHEYNQLNDGKTIPGWTLSLHRTYSRLILYFGTN